MTSEPPSGWKKRLWVDDCKERPDESFAVATTYDTALTLLRHVPYEELYLDHDLGDARTGLDLLRQLIAEGCVPPTVVCISYNPVGRRAIEAELAAFREPRSELVEPTRRA